MTHTTPNPNGNFEEKFLYYFYAHRESERVGREHIAANAELVRDNLRLEVENRRLKNK